MKITAHMELSTSLNVAICSKRTSNVEDVADVETCVSSWVTDSGLDD